MRKTLFILAFLTLCIGTPVFIACTNNNSSDTAFDIKYYKGCKIMGKMKSDNDDWNWYILKNDSIVKLVYIPIWIDKVYTIGDSIK